MVYISIQSFQRDAVCHVLFILFFFLSFSIVRLVHDIKMKNKKKPFKIGAPQAKIIQQASGREEPILLSEGNNFLPCTHHIIRRKLLYFVKAGYHTPKNQNENIEETRNIKITVSSFAFFFWFLWFNGI